MYLREQQFALNSANSVFVNAPKATLYPINTRYQNASVLSRPKGEFGQKQQN